MDNKKFNELFNLTNEHLKEKKYLFKPQIYSVYKNDFNVKIGSKVINEYGKAFYNQHFSSGNYTDKILFEGTNELGKEINRKLNDNKEIVFKKGEAVIDKNGKIIYKNVTPTPNKNIMLSIAYSMSLENYQSIRYEITSNENKKKLDFSELSDMLVRYFSNKYYKNIDDLKPKTDNSQQENTLIDLNQNFEYENIENFRQIEYKIYAVVNALRNYHSHFVHEPSSLSFEDYFEIEYSHKNINGVKIKTKKQDHLDEVKGWFQKRFNDAKKHLSTSLKSRLLFLEGDTNPKSKLDKSAKKIKVLKKVIEDLQFYFLLKKDNSLSLEGQLFIATMFLYKRQAKLILEKWRNVKQPEGYQNTLYTFFTYYCLSERYSLHNFSDPLLKFRDITSKLSNMPSSTNPQLQFIYDKIKELNECNYKDIDNNKETIKNKKQKLRLEINEISINISKLNENEKNYNKILKILNKDREKIEKKLIALSTVKENIIPIRKRNILTAILLQYLLDNKLFFKGVKIAVRKTPRDITDYFKKEKYIDNKSSIVEIITECKEKINDKNTSENEKAECRNIIKEKKELRNSKLYLDSLPKIKEKLKKLKKEEKTGEKEYKVLRENFKELKRNFVYKTPKTLEELQKPTEIEAPKENNEDKPKILYVPAQGFRFTVKENNALIQYNNFYSITLSPDLLIKWVFIHLTEKEKLIEGKKLKDNPIEMYIKAHIKRLNNEANNTDAEKVIKDFIFNRYASLKDENIDFKTLVANYNNLDQSNYPNSMNLNKVFPKSIMDALDLRKEKIKKEDRVDEKLKNKIKSLNSFFTRNQKYDSSWKHESKEKIDLLFEYIHYSLIKDVYNNKINENDDEYKKNEKKLDQETFIRKRYFSVSTYQIAREYFRYYGRYENNTIEGVEGYNDLDFVQPNIIYTLKEKYKKCFSYLKKEIKNNKSLEDLFNEVILKYISSLKALQTKNKTNTVPYIEKILKIDKENTLEVVNDNLKTNFLTHFALGHNVISIKSILDKKWRKFEENRGSNLKKTNHYSDFSFIRKTLEATDNGNLKTNIDYIFKVILPQTTEVKNNNNKIRPTIFQKLLKMKTEELILWNIAKSYRSSFNIDALHNQNTNNNTESFQVFTTFNKVYKMDLDYTKTIGKDFWYKKNKKGFINQTKYSKVLSTNKKLKDKDLVIKLKVPAKRYDNKFLKIETQLITEYILWNCIKDDEIVLNSNHRIKNVQRPYDLNKFEDLIKVIYRELKLSFVNIGEILRAEKKLMQVTNNNFCIKENLTKKYVTDKNNFFLSFTDNDSAILKLFKGNNTTFTDNDLRFFRNNALHYQLQDPIIKKAIKDRLKIINGKLKYATEQEFTRIER